MSFRVGTVTPKSRCTGYEDDTQGLVTIRNTDTSRERPYGRRDAKLGAPRCRTIGDLRYDPQGSDHPSSDPPGRW